MTDQPSPRFPSLYWPFPIDYDQNPRAQFLTSSSEVVRFTVLWTLFFTFAIYLLAFIYTAVRLRRAFKILWGLPIFNFLVAGIEALIVAGIAGGLGTLLYRTAEAKLSTWLPFVWGLIGSLVIMLKAGF